MSAPADARRRPARTRAGVDRGGERRIPLPTGRGTLLLVLGAILYAAGANVSSGWTLVVAAGCLGAVGWAWLVVRRATPRLGVARELPDVATAGEPTHVAVRVDGADGVVVVVADPATGLVGVVDRDRDRVEASVVLRRGRVAGTQLLVRCTDPLGLAAAWRRVDGGGATTVLPAGRRLVGPDDGGDGGGGERDGGAPSQRRDPGPELVGLRDHQHGDPLAAVHWRASARRGELVSRDARQPRQERRDVVLEAGVWDRDRLDLAASVVVELAEEGMRAGRPVTVCADGVRLAWGPAARAHLATLPPATGVESRPLARTDLDPRADVVHVAPVPAGVEVRGPTTAPRTLPLPAAAGASASAGPQPVTTPSPGRSPWDG